MKKIVMSLALLVLVSLPFFAQNSEENSGEFTYFNVQVLRVYEHREAYLVLYNKTSTKMGQVAVPKEWFKYDSANHSRVRPLPAGVNPYMTVIYKDNEFYKVYLNMPTDRSNSAWAVLSPNIDISSKINKETLEIEF
ncbi:MAG: hypothetical protein KA785_06375 [Spirochaetaceae bacterium]|nr:hypothetical protein [Spirochaetaceae bacterium]